MIWSRRTAALHLRLEGTVNELVIRRAGAEDACAVADIYNHYIRNSTATFDTVERSVDDRVEWLAGHDDEHPVLVAQTGERVTGWGSVTRWGTRPAWWHTVELSVYVAADAVGSGVGPQLLDAIVEEARRAGHHALVAQIVTENERSLRMAARAGFERVGAMHQVGYKFDRWIDLALLERILD